MLELVLESMLALLRVVFALLVFGGLVVVLLILAVAANKLERWVVDLVQGPRIITDEDIEREIRKGAALLAVERTRGPR